MIRGLPLRKSLVRIPAQSQTQIHTLALIPGRNPLPSPIFYRGNPLSCLRKITCQESKGSGGSEKDFSLRSHSNLPLKEKQIIKKNNTFYNPLSNAKSEKEKLIKNDQKRTSSKEP